MFIEPGIVFSRLSAEGPEIHSVHDLTTFKCDDDSEEGDKVVQIDLARFLHNKSVGVFRK